MVLIRYSDVMILLRMTLLDIVMQLETDPSLDLSEVLIIVDPLDATKVQCGGVRCGTVLCGAVQCGGVRCSAVDCSAVECGACLLYTSDAADE